MFDIIKKNTCKIALSTLIIPTNTIFAKNIDQKEKSEIFKVIDTWDAEQVKDAIANGANIKDTYRDDNLLHYVIEGDDDDENENYSQNYKEIFIVLVDAGADLEALNCCNETVIQAAVNSLLDSAIVKKLITAGANTTITNDEQKTLIHLLLNEFEEMFEDLTESQVVSMCKEIKRKSGIDLLSDVKGILQLLVGIDIDINAKN